MLPDRILSPTFTDIGSDSPVRALVSNIEEPFTMVPSSGTLSPSLTTIISPTFISVVGTTIILFFSFRFDVSSLISISSATELRLLFTAMLSNTFPKSYKNRTINPSWESPSAKAPRADIVTRKFSFITFFLNCLIAVNSVLYIRIM